MADIDFMELAIYCQNKYKENNTSDKKRYIGTKFVAITKDGEVIPSETPHILKMAEQSILLHYSSESTSTIERTQELVQFINKDGVVYNQWLDNRFWLYQKYYKSIGYVVELGYLDNGKRIYFSLEPTHWENSIRKVWELYSRVRDLNSSEKINLVAELFSKNEKILELEKQVEDFRFTKYLLEQERNQYKSLLDEIKQIVDKK